MSAGTGGRTPWGWVVALVVAAAAHAGMTAMVIAAYAAHTPPTPTMLAAHGGTGAVVVVVAMRQRRYRALRYAPCPPLAVGPLLPRTAGTR